MPEFDYKAIPRPRVGSVTQAVVRDVPIERPQERTVSPAWQGVVDAIGIITVLVTTGLALLVLIMVIYWIIIQSSNISRVTIFSALGAILWALVYRLLTIGLRRSAERIPTSPTAIALTLLTAVIVIGAPILRTDPGIPIIWIGLIGIGMLGVVIVLILLYFAVILVERISESIRKPPPATPPAAPPPPTPPPVQPRQPQVAASVPVTPYTSLSPEQTVMRREALLRYTVLAIAGILVLLSLVLLIISYGRVYEFLVAAPLILLFPFSYLAYFAFQRNVQIERLRRDFLLMGIPWDEELYHQAQGFWNFALHISMAILMTVVGITLFFIPESFFNVSTSLLSPAVLQALRYGFIGAYLFSIQLIYRRYTTSDLQPYVYLYCALTILAGLAFNYAAFETLAIVSGNAVTTGELEGIGGGLAALLAFALGFFPLLAIQWITRTAYNAFGLTNRRSEDLLLSLIDGISQFHETRLRDQGIDDIENLASVNIPSLMINTRFSAPQVVDWVDQANLYLYLTSSEIPSFREGRIRSVSDFRDWWGDYYIDPKDQPPADTPPKTDADRTKAAMVVKSTSENLDSLYRATERGSNINFVMNYWRNSSLDLQEFYDARYSSASENALFLEETDEDKRKLQEAQKVITSLAMISNGKVTANNGKALAGLARLTLERLAVEQDLPLEKQLTAVETGIKYFHESRKSNTAVEAQAKDDLKGLTDAMMKVVEEKVKQAKALTTNDEKTKILVEAVSLTERARETSRLCYKDRSCNISYTCRLADLKNMLADLGNMPADLKNILAKKNEALGLYQQALAHADTITKIPDDGGFTDYKTKFKVEYETMQISIKHIEADLKRLQATTDAEKQEALQHYLDVKARAEVIKDFDEEKLKKMKDAIEALKNELSNPAPPAMSASITEPAANATVTGDPISVSGTAAGIPNNKIRLRLALQDGTLVTEVEIPLTGADTGTATWTQQPLATNGQQGAAVISILTGQSGQETTLATVNVTLQP